MGAEEDKQKHHLPPPVRPIEVKTYIMSCQNKMLLYRNKKVYEIKKKKDEAIMALKQNNLDIAKAKMESVIRLEDLITVYDILGPLCEILKERITYICEATEVPPDIKAQMDTIIYASSRVDIPDLFTLRSLIQRKYGAYYIQSAEQNRDGLVNVNVVEKLKIKPPVDAFLTIRLKQLCKEKKINFEFPEEIAPNFDQGMGMDPYGGGAPGGNPYEMGGGNYNNPYEQGNNNNFGGNYGGNNNNAGGGDFEAYMRGGAGPGPQGNGNPYSGGNPYGGQGGNPYEAAPAGQGGNPYGGGNPYDQGGNPYAGPGGNNQPGAGGNPYDQGNNDFNNPYQ